MISTACEGWIERKRETDDPVYNIGSVVLPGHSLYILDALSLQRPCSVGLALASTCPLTAGDHSNVIRAYLYLYVVHLNSSHPSVHRMCHRLNKAIHQGLIFVYTPRPILPPFVKVPFG